MSDVYKQFDTATANITATALIYAGKPAGRIVLKHGAAVTAYVQIWGVEMVKGRATGGGYDRATAAIESAVSQLKNRKPSEGDNCAQTALWAMLRAFDGADDGSRWTKRLETCGFTVATVTG